MSFLLALIPGPIKRALAWATAGALALLGAFIAGNVKGRQAAKSADAEKVAKDTKTALEVRHEVEVKSDADVRDALSKWMRDE